MARRLARVAQEAEEELATDQPQAESSAHFLHYRAALGCMSNNRRDLSAFLITICDNLRDAPGAESAPPCLDPVDYANRDEDSTPVMPMAE